MRLHPANCSIENFMTNAADQIVHEEASIASLTHDPAIAIAYSTRFRLVEAAKKCRSRGRDWTKHLGHAFSPRKATDIADEKESNHKIVVCGNSRSIATSGQSAIGRNNE